MQIGLGTAAIGRPHYINLRQEENKPFSLDDFKAQGIAILDEAYHLGVRYFDTAPGYGIAEQLIMNWISDRQHKEVEIATKWGYTYTANFQKDALVHEVKEHSLAKLNEQWRQSKHLLPYLTSYQIHSATFESGVLENDAVLNRLDQLKNEFGLKIGLTTTGANQIEVLKRSLEIEINGTPLFNVFQVTYNIMDQSLKAVLLELAETNTRVVVKEALANGRIFKNANYPHYWGLYDELAKLANQYQVGVDAVALRYCLDSIQPFSVLSGASTIPQLSENLSSMTFKLTDTELDRLGQYAVAPGRYWEERKLLSWN